MYCTLRQRFNSWSTMADRDFRDTGSCGGTGSLSAGLHKQRPFVCGGAGHERFGELVVERRHVLEPLCESVRVGDTSEARLRWCLRPVVEDPALTFQGARTSYRGRYVDVHVVGIFDGDTSGSPSYLAVVPGPRLAIDGQEQQVQNLLWCCSAWQVELCHYVEVELVVGHSGRDDRANRHGTLGVEKIHEPGQWAPIAFDPVVERIV